MAVGCFFKTGTDFFDWQQRRLELTVVYQWNISKTSKSLGDDFMNSLRKAIIKWRTRRVLAKLGIVKPPVDAETVARALGFDVVYASLEGEDMGAVLGFSNPEDRTIYVTKERSFADKQMTIAVEVGKAVLHPRWWKDEKQYRLRTLRGPLHPEEFEAEWFALNLLVPHRWVTDLQKHASMHELEKIFAADRQHIVGAIACELPN
jgi:hypothetical protein